MKTFTSYTDLPSFSPDGYYFRLVPDKVWGYIQDVYSLLKLKEPIEDIGFDAVLYPLSDVHYLSNLIMDELKPIHEEWCGEELIPQNIYGVRSYRKGSKLPIHRDHIKTHHISCIIMLEKDEEWRLELESHSRDIVRIDLNPGGMLMYESAKCRHARTIPFTGSYYNNFYVHYTLKNYEYIT